MAMYEKRQGKKVRLNKKNLSQQPVNKPERAQKMPKAKPKPAVKNEPTEIKKEKSGSYQVLHNRRPKKGFILLSTLALLVLAAVIWQLVLPTGILEYLQNSYALHSTDGSGQTSLFGTTFLQMNTRYGRIDLLSGAYYESYNTSGGTAYTVQHGFSSPVMVSSNARTLIYERDGEDLNIYNLSKLQQHLKVDGQLYTATISRNGNVATAYKSNDYLSVVEVYTKGSKLLFTHNFSNEYVTSLALNTTGRYLTVTTLYAKGGIYHSNLYSFDVKKRAQKLKNSYENMYFTAAESLGRGTTLAVSYDKAIIASPAKGTITELNISEKIRNYSVSANGTVACVCNQTDNTINNKIRLFDKKGEKIKEFDFIGNISEFSISNSHIYILSDAVLHCYAIKDLTHTQHPFENAQLLSAFNGGAAAVSDSKLSIITKAQMSPAS